MNTVEVVLNFLPSLKAYSIDFQCKPYLYNRYLGISTCCPSYTTLQSIPGSLPIRPLLIIIGYSNPSPALKEHRLEAAPSSLRSAP